LPFCRQNRKNGKQQFAGKFWKSLKRQTAIAGKMSAAKRQKSGKNLQNA